MFLSFFKKTPKPFNEGFLAVGSGHEIHFAEYGNPKGIPVILFHGGPGGSMRPHQVEAYDLSQYHIILFSQRGCGQSKFIDLLKDNTPQEAVSDAEKLLKHLNIPMENLIVFGASYGSTLALLFAEKYPKAVQMLLLNSIFLGRSIDLDWVDKESARFYPDLMHEMKSILKPKETLLEGYRRLALSEKYEEIKLAQKYYGAYERFMGQLNPSFKDVTSLSDSKINSMRIFIEYEYQRMFLKENEILKNIGKIKHIPTLIVHNRLDMVCPVNQAWDLSRALDNCVFKIVPDKGHWSPLLGKELKKQMGAFLEKNISKQ